MANIDDPSEFLSAVEQAISNLRFPPTHPVRSGVVAKPDPLHQRWLAGDVTAVEAINEMVESGMDMSEADEIVNGWIKAL